MYKRMRRGKGGKEQGDNEKGKWRRVWRIPNIGGPKKRRKKTEKKNNQNSRVLSRPSLEKKRADHVCKGLLGKNPDVT